ncbi:DUF29 domain-containing protein [Candidatus Thiodictyon syntrophicum]|jgi:hypothetical protein|uniref:DUF29 domain-containing protein n=1 Tax=Candidatus Thiodictyon syntrophicum TaxID=1166950 RepID=A0A2K8UD32_9GAMM|nr:DUF29 domain-containing protein [Candidatus Thiodictyon syntrophicum]AUB83482.1 hypothetical protein THSYN_22715 [Candidatus Thiodictyon syntrophicum]
MATHRYEQDIVAWADEQARLLRAGDFTLLDLEHIAEEIEDVGKSERRELKSRMAVLLAHLLKWQYQPERRGNSRRRTIRIQRRSVIRCLAETLSLKADLRDAGWWEQAWDDAISNVLKEVEIDDLPETCPWSMDDILNDEFWPEP